MAEPVQWDADKLQAATSYLDFELRYALSTRQPLEKAWRRWLEAYRAPAIQPVRQFPFEGAANNIMPIIATDVDQLYATFMQSIHATDEVWSVTPMNERWVASAKPLQDYLSFIDRAILNMYSVNQRALLEMVKLGTCIYKTGWLYERRRVNSYNEDGKVVPAERTISKPFVDHVRLNDFLIPPYAYAVQPDEQGGAPWVAERLRISTDRLQMLARSTEPMLPNISQANLDRVLGVEETSSTEYDQKIQDLDYIKRGTRGAEDFDRDTNSVDSGAITGGVGSVVREVEVWEVHARLETQAGKWNDVILLYHLPTQTILRGVYNYFVHGKRPYEVSRYFPGEGFYGIGVCEQTEMFQTQISDFTNYQQDNVLLANSMMIATREGSSIGPNEPFYSGKVIISQGDPREEVVPIKMGTVYQDIPNMIQFMLNQKERRNSVSDLALGNMAALPSRTPATSVQAMLAEGKRRPDLTLKDLRYSGLARVGLRIVQLLQQFGSRPANGLGGERVLQLAVEVLGSPEGMEVVNKLSTPLEDAELGVGVSITAVSALGNKEMERQQFQSLLQIMAQQVYPQFMQAAQMAVMPDPKTGMPSPLASVGRTMCDGITELSTRLLEQYDIRNPEQMVPVLPPAPPPAPPAVPGANGALAGPGGPGGGAPGLGGLQGLFGGAGGGVPPAM
jgi:hypothetical protein